MVVVIVAAVVVEAVVLTAGCPAVVVDIAEHPTSAWPATGQYFALGWDASVALSGVGCPSAAADGAAPSVAYSAATESLNCYC